MDDSDDEFVPDDDVPMRQARPRPAPKKKPAAAGSKSTGAPHAAQQEHSSALPTPPRATQTRG